MLLPAGKMRIQAKEYQFLTCKFFKIVLAFPPFCMYNNTEQNRKGTRQADLPYRFAEDVQGEDMIIR